MSKSREATQLYVHIWLNRAGGEATSSMSDSYDEAMQALDDWTDGCGDYTRFAYVGTHVDRWEGDVHSHEWLFLLPDLDAWRKEKVREAEQKWRKRHRRGSWEPIDPDDPFCQTLEYSPHDEIQRYLADLNGQPASRFTRKP